MQKVNVNNKLSAWEDIYSGVPLCPLLFTLFRMDLFGAAHRQGWAGKKAPIPSVKSIRHM